MIKHLILLQFLLFSWPLIAQNQDTIPEQFENFFGSDCDLDTLVFNSVRNSEIIFYKNEIKLVRVKNEKIKWTADLSSVSKEYPGKKFCVIEKGVEGKPRKTYVFLISDSGECVCTLRSLNGKLTYRRNSKMRCRRSSWFQRF